MTTFTDNFLTARSTPAWLRTSVAGVYQEAEASELARSNMGVAAYKAIQNCMRYPAYNGAATGSPGTLPTAVAEAVGSSGLTRQSVTVRVNADGTTSLGLRYSGTGVAAFLVLQLESANNQTGVQGDIFSYGLDVEIETHGSGARPSAVGMYIYERNAAVSAVVSNVALVLDTSVRAYHVHTRALTNATTAYAQPVLHITPTASVSNDFTIWLTAPTFIKEGFGYRAPIYPATSGKFTRNADNIVSLAGSGPTPFPGFDPTGFSFVGSIRLDELGLGVSRPIYDLNDSSTDEQVLFEVTASDTLKITVRTGAAEEGSLEATLPIGNTGRVVFAGNVSEDGLELVLNAGAPIYYSDDTAISMPTGLDQAAKVGSDVSGNSLNAIVEQLFFGALADAGGLLNWTLEN